MTADLVIYGAGQRDPLPLDPSSMQFKAQPVERDTCVGCAFRRQWSSVCNRAIEVAKLAGLPVCTQGFVYVAVEVDSRQMDFLKDGQPDECESSSSLAKSRG